MPRKRAGTNRFLPKYVSKFESQHGKVRYRFRRAGYPTGYFTTKLGTEEFRAEYEAFNNPGVIAKPAPTSRAKAGTLDDLLDRYMSVPERLGPTAITQQKIRAVLEDFRNGDKPRGHRQTSTITFEAIDKIIAKKLIKTDTGNKTKGGLHAARKLRKELMRLFEFAERAGLIDKNPVALSRKVNAPAGERSDGFHSWTEEEIAQFRARWPLGTRQRLAMELALWTD